MSIWNTFDNLHLISIIVSKGNSELVIDEGKKAGALVGTITHSRGFQKTEKRRLFSAPSISPAKDIIRLLVPDFSINSVLNSVIKFAGLDQSGAGAIYTVPIEKLFAVGDSVSIPDPPKEIPELEYKLNENLMQIICISQTGKGDIIAEAAVEAGSSGPVVFFGEGRGIRDRMGIWRIAVNPAKELVTVITGELEADQIFEAMVDAGKLTLPGMGFIHMSPVEKGLVNLVAIDRGSSSQASLEQIVRAIDDLKGNQKWRMSGSVKAGAVESKRKYLRNLINLRCVTRRGLGDQIISSAMAAGAPGATLSYANLIGGEKVVSIIGRTIADEREIIDFILAPDKVEGILNAIGSVVEEVKSKNTFVFEMPVPKALTYLG